MTSMNLQKLLLGTLGLMFTACDVPDEEVTERGYNSNVSSGECPPWECGYNSAEVNGRAIRELNLDGLANSDGMRIIGFVAPAGILGSYKLDVQGDELVAVGKFGTTLRGHQLLGATILVKPVGLLKPSVPITIAGYSEQKSWAAGGAPVPSYALVYPDVDALLGQRNVCVGDMKDTLASSAVVLGGETYDLESKTVVPDRDRWLTIACAGSATAKMRLMNYGPQSDFDGSGNAASVAQRQATLKMLTADYCGNGTSYTANGTRLAWENADGTVATTTPVGALEAVWTSKGALCLEATRLADADVACGLPACDKIKDPLVVGEWLTHVPMVK